jgi:hypothetical protein
MDLNALMQEIVAGEQEDVKGLMELSGEEELKSLLERLVPKLQRFLRKLGGRMLSELIQERLNREGLGRPMCGVRRYRTRCWQTVLGQLKLERGCARAADGRENCPADRMLALPAGGYSREMEWLIVLLSTQGAYQVEMEHLRQLLGMEVSVRAAEDLVAEHGKRLVQVQQKEQEQVFWERAAVQAETTADRFVASVDAGKYRSREQAKEPWKEMKIGCVGHLDEQGQSCGGKLYVADNDKDRLGRQMYVEALRHGLEQAKEVLTIADGAPMNWKLMAEHFPENRVEILDYYHAAEHITASSEGIYGQGTDRAIRWARTQRRRLKAGHVQRVLDELARQRDQLGPRPSEARKVLSDNLDYFRANKARMRYKDFRQRGYPIGSGMIESACKQIITARLKGSGMRWRQAGALHMAKLRALALSGRLYRFILRRTLANAA